MPRNRKFSKVVLASTGDHPKGKDEKIKNWVEHAGGTFVKDGLSKEVTHLLCSEKAWKKYYPIVQNARRQRTIDIVKLNWLEDSLLGKSGKPLDTTGYQFEQRKVTKCGIRKRKRVAEDESVDGDGDDEAKQPKPVKRTRKQKTLNAEGEQLSKDNRVAQAGKEFDEACVEFETIMGQKGYRPFTDQSGFVYLLTLVRKDILKNRLEKHRIKVRYAPYFSVQPSTFIPITRQGVNPERKNSEGSLSIFESVEYPSSTDALGADNVPLGDPILPPCPVPLYYFPKPYPYSHNPVIASSLPRKLTSANPKLRVRIADPWAQSLQLFVSDTPPEANSSGKPIVTTPGANRHPDLAGLQTKTFAAYTVLTRPGIRNVGTMAPPGSTFDYMWAMFTKMFKSRTGVSWTDVHNGWKKGIKFENFRTARPGGEDGADETQLWDVLEPPISFRGASGRNEESIKSTETREEIPSVTVVMNTTEVVMGDHMEAKAMTPTEGW